MSMIAGGASPTVTGLETPPAKPRETVSGATHRERPRWRWARKGSDEGQPARFRPIIDKWAYPWRG